MLERGLLIHRWIPDFHKSIRIGEGPETAGCVQAMRITRGKYNSRKKLPSRKMVTVVFGQRAYFLIAAK
jgi:hypothetical protein